MNILKLSFNTFGLVHVIPLTIILAAGIGYYLLASTHDPASKDH